MNTKYAKIAEVIYQAVEHAVETLRTELEAEGTDVSGIASSTMLVELVAQVLIQGMIQERLAFNPGSDVNQVSQEAVKMVRQTIVNYRRERYCL